MNLRTYEGLFLIDPVTSQDWDGIKNKVAEMLTRRDGQIISAKKWGERKLAYEIKGHKRGTYLLVYFQMPPENITVVKRDIQLAEIVLRMMILAYKKPVSIQEETTETAEGTAESSEETGEETAEASEETAETAETAGTSEETTEASEETTEASDSAAESTEEDNTKKTDA